MKPSKIQLMKQKKREYCSLVQPAPAKNSGSGRPESIPERISTEVVPIRWVQNPGKV